METLCQRSSWQRRECTSCVHWSKCRRTALTFRKFIVTQQLSWVFIGLVCAFSPVPTLKIKLTQKLNDEKRTCGCATLFERVNSNLKQITKENLDFTIRATSSSTIFQLTHKFKIECTKLTHKIVFAIFTMSCNVTISTDRPNKTPNEVSFLRSLSETYCLMANRAERAAA